MLCDAAALLEGVRRARCADDPLNSLLAGGATAAALVGITREKSKELSIKLEALRSRMHVRLASVRTSWSSSEIILPTAAGVECQALRSFLSIYVCSASFQSSREKPLPGTNQLCEP